MYTQFPERESFRINITPCPPGYVISASDAHPHVSECKCAVENEAILSCNDLNIKIKVSYVVARESATRT